MGLTKRIQRMLRQIQQNPLVPPVYELTMPPRIRKELERYLIQATIDNPRKMAWIHRYYGGDTTKVIDEVNYTCIALRHIGVEDEATLSRILLWEFDWEVIETQARDLDDADEALLKYARPFLRRARSELTNYEWHYAQANDLCHHDGQRWYISHLGETVLRLPELEATRFLLALEIFLGEAKDNQWQVPLEMLEQLMTDYAITQETLSSIARDQSQVKAKLWQEHLCRLGEFGLVKSPHRTAKPTRMGEVIIGSVVNRDSVFDTLIPEYVRVDITGRMPLQLTNGEDMSRFMARVKGSEWIGNLRDTILEDAKRLTEADTAYLNIFKSLAPSIEGLLNRIATHRNIVYSGYGINRLTKALEDAGVLSSQTAAVADGVVRTCRNEVSHGNPLAPQLARSLCELSLMAIESILNDYERASGSE